MSAQLKPLSDILDNVLDRIAVIEAKLGITTSSPISDTTAKAMVIDKGAEDELHPRLVAYDEHVQRALIPFVDSCTSLGTEMQSLGSNISEIWNSMRYIVELGTTYKRPLGDVAGALQPHLKCCQEAIEKVRSARIDRKFDWHVKVIMEMLTCVSWVVLTPPPSPSSFVKDSIGASDFWANKIRKEYKTNESEGHVHIKFCETIKALIVDLATYLKEFHLSGLAWNPNGRDFSEAEVGKISSGERSKSNPPPIPEKSTQKEVTAGIFDELKMKKTSDGSSAATGLRKVTKDQQTWRKEYKKPDEQIPQKQNSVLTTSTVAAIKSEGRNLGTAKCEYQERGCKWNIENQTKNSCAGSVCKVDVTDPKQQVYIYNCQDILVQITGKLKSVTLDSCTKCGVVFDTAISACEVVNCKSVQVQATNLCPSFSIDKTDGCIVHLTHEAVGLCSFITSKSSEMNVSWPDDKGEIHEAPIPEQFQHKITNGTLISQVSDLYH